MRCLAVFRRLGLLLLASVITASVAGRLSAQTTTGTIRGYVRDSSGAALSDAQLQVRNVANGSTREATSRPDGSYIFLGLEPASYELTVRHIGHGAQVRHLTLAIGTTVLADFALGTQAVELAGLQVTAAQTAIETRTSEVATNISQQQIARLPSPSRNFLDLAGLAPGVTVAEDRMNGTSRTFSAGGQGPNSVNVFVDGTSLKNDLTQGGITGQDASRGNPFPKSAIQEYRVISQNFKAEYQKASSAVITATTKSGSNVWTGDVIFGYQNKGLVALDTFQRRDKRVADSIGLATAQPSTFKVPDYSRYLTSISAGGPIMQDKLFFFGSYEGNYQNRDNSVRFTPPTGIAALDSVNLTQYNGNFQSPFRETQIFGKLNYNVSNTSSAELSFSNRHESDVRDFGGTNAFQEAVNFLQNVSIAQLRFEHATGPWLDEAKVNYSFFQRNPTPNTPGLPARVFHYPGQDAQIGSNLSIQNFIQKDLGFRNDLTYSGMSQHVFKGGVSVDFARYDITKRNNETPEFEYAQYVDPVNYGWTTDTTALKFNFRTPFKLTYGTGIPGVNLPNTQLGAYIQDDWTPTPRLTLNLGIRWDMETHMMNTSYVTPQEVVDTLTRYNDSLATPLDLSRYISTGNNRKPFLGAFQPRVGFSYALDENNKTTLFGGAGIYYDRSLFDFSVDEIQKLTHPTYTILFADPDSAAAGNKVQWQNSYLTADTTALNTLVHSFGQPEAFLLDNKMKPPMSKQWNLGVRRMLGESMIATVTYQGERGTGLFTYNWANFALDSVGHCCNNFNIGNHGFANIIYSTNQGKTWYDAISLQVDRPYRQSSSGYGWGWGVVYTYAKRSVAGIDNLNDLNSSFPGAFPNALAIGKHSDNGGNDERQRIVANWTADLPFAFGIQFSGLLTLGSGAILDVGCPARFCGPATYINGGFTPTQYSSFIPGGWAYRRVDVSFRKDFPRISGTSLGITLDIFNVFNYQNFGCYDVGFHSPTYGQSTCVVSDARHAQLGAEYNF